MSKESKGSTGEDTRDYYDRRDQERANRPTCLKVWDRISSRISRVCHSYLRPEALQWRMVAFFQRRWRGFDDASLQSLDYTILEFILPRLKRFRSLEQTGWPGAPAIFDIDYEVFEDLSEEEQDDLNDRSFEEWERMLDKMIRAIELQIEYAGLFLIPNPSWKPGDSRRDRYVESPELKAEYEEGWKIFIEYFHALWD